MLFLVDRLELEDQARKALLALLSADFQTVIYKENRDDWRRAEIVVTTVQSLLSNNKYQKLFYRQSPGPRSRSVRRVERLCKTVDGGQRGRVFLLWSADPAHTVFAGERRWRMDLMTVFVRDA